MKNKEATELRGIIFNLKKEIERLQNQPHSFIVYSEARGQFLGKTEWVHTTLSAKPFRTVDEARMEVHQRIPEGKTETIALLDFKCREIVGLSDLFTPAAKRHYNKVMTEA